MNRAFFCVVLSILFCACDWAPQIEINPEQYELSSVGGEVVFTATADGIIDIEWSRGSSDPEEPERKDDGKVLVLDGGWYQIQWDRERPRKILVSVSENTTSEQRKVSFGCAHYLGGYISFHSVIQKGRVGE